MHRIAAAISVFLFLTGFWICAVLFPDAFLPNDHPKYPAGISHFTDLRYSIYAILIGLMFFAYLQETKDNWCRAIMVFGTVLSASDLLDRFISNTTTFTDSDKFGIAVSLIIAIVSYARGRKKAVHK